MTQDIKPRRWTTDELAAVLLGFPAGTPIVGMGDDGSGYTLAVCCEMIVESAERLNEARCPYSALQWPAKHLVIVPIEPHD